MFSCFHHFPLSKTSGSIYFVIIKLETLSELLFRKTLTGLGFRPYLNFQTKSNLTIVLDLNAGAKVILDLTSYVDLGFGKTVNEMVG